MKLNRTIHWQKSWNKTTTNIGAELKIQESKKLVLLGIRRKGEKMFNVRLDKSLKSNEDLLEAKEILFNKSSQLEAVGELSSDKK